MLCLEVSSLGSACNKNPFESRNKTMFMQLCKSQKSKYKEIMFKNGIIKLTDKVSKDQKFKDIYNHYKKSARNVEDFDQIERKVIEKFKEEEPDAPVENLVKTMKCDLKKDCGKNNEEGIIKKKCYKKGNDKLLIYKNEKGWELKGFHDASQDEVVIEIKTRMSLNNVRKNEYDLYQLFGYLLVMGKSKGKIVQMFNNEIFDSDTETNKEYGLIDISIEPWKSKYQVFTKEIDSFFEEVVFYSERTFDIWKVFDNFNLPICYFDRYGIYFNIKPGFEKIIKLIN